eukprot:TRINITY_DN6237_c0_g1_i1.p1 TRINITY_DN6237_c0_g1~~TRINITY_DN6237_c0_g1_i1.p1  ORF type:complete len:1099 (+),score=231.60 TRINITY_DN6237_c0_g1_i1:22-3318(+)
MEFLSQSKILTLIETELPQIFSQVKSVFEASCIDGFSLVYMTEAHLVELGFPLGVRIRLFQWIVQLRDSVELEMLVGGDFRESEVWGMFREWTMLNDVVPDDVKVVLFKLDDATPFESDEAYIECVEARFVLKHLRIGIADYVKTLKNSLKFGERNNKIKEGLDKLIEYLDNVLNKKIEAADRGGEVVPRFIRMSREYNFTKKELLATQYIYLCNIGTLFLPPQSITNKGEKRNMAFMLSQFSGMNSIETLDFFNQNRTHIQQGLFSLEDEYTNFFNSLFLVMSQEVLSVLSGKTLSSDEFYKIDKTVLANIISNEPTFNIIPNKDTLNGNNKLEETDDIVIEYSDDLELDLEKILAEVSDLTHNYSIPDINSIESESPDTIKVYTNDLEYLEDQFSILEMQIRIRKFELTSEDDVSFSLRQDSRKPEAIIRELKAKQRVFVSKLENRLSQTLISKSWIPRLETLARLRKLDEFEKNVLLALIGSVISQKIRLAISSNNDYSSNSFDVGTLIALFCESLESQIKGRTYFYRNSKIVKEGLITILDSSYRKKSDLMEYTVEVDRRLLDYIVGLDTELSEIIDGGDLYIPDVTLEQVVLPEDQKKLILDTIKNVDKFNSKSRELKFYESIPYGLGICLLFYGPSGTGKTMTANAVAHHLGKRVLLVNIPSLSSTGTLSKETLRLIFREAKIHDAVIFFDECESLFESRNNTSNSEVTSLLNDIEKYEGLIILATNRPYDLDEAMHRRISVAIEFKSPDYILRQKIWESHVPTSVSIDQGVDWSSLAMDYEITGGFIKNAMLNALSTAISRDGDLVNITQEDLENGAKLQLRGHLHMIDIDKLRRVIPKKGISNLVLKKSNLKKVQEIVGLLKSKKIVYGQWGFGETSTKKGTLLLIKGPSGTGKFSIAEAIGYEIGRAIIEINCAEFANDMTRTSMRLVQHIFKDARSSDSVLVFKNAHLLFSEGYGTYSQQNDASVFVHYIENYSGLTVLTTQETRFELSIFSQLHHEIDLDKPSEKLRKQLWQALLPQKCPTEKIDFENLARSFKFSGGEIESIIIQAAETCALKAEPERIITQNSLRETAEAHSKSKTHSSYQKMFN